MNEIETQFNAAFSHWNIRLPPEDLAQRRRGKIVQAGWTIWYLFGADEHGDYLDYYATHHMTNDRHVRLYANGRSEGLPTMQEFRRGSEDPEEDARRRMPVWRRNTTPRIDVLPTFWRPRGLGRMEVDHPVAAAECYGLPRLTVLLSSA
jgi:hypothetical protein